jgi:hypothetical protein
MSTRPLSTIVFCSLLFLSLAGLAHAQSANTENTLRLDTGGQSPAATIADCQWLAGDWTGEALGGSFEETWNPPSGNTMLGMFKLVVDGKTVFSEIMMIHSQDDSIQLRLKHFDDQLHGWEDKEQTVDFPLVKLTKNEAFFSGLTFRSTGPKTLEIFVAQRKPDGSHSELVFKATRRQKPKDAHE